MCISVLVELRTPLDVALMFLSGYALARPLSSLVQKSIIPVDLDYTSYIPLNGNKTQNALVLLHGLLYVRSDSFSAAV